LHVCITSCHRELWTATVTFQTGLYTSESYFRYVAKQVLNKKVKEETEKKNEKKTKIIPSTESHSGPYFQSAPVFNAVTERLREWLAHTELPGPIREQIKEKTKKSQSA